VTLKACWDVWCDLCGEPAQPTAGGSSSKRRALALALVEGWKLMRVDGRLRDVCWKCWWEEDPHHPVRQRLHEKFSIGQEAPR
jgi:hypothetical protein